MLVWQRNRFISASLLLVCLISRRVREAASVRNSHAEVPTFNYEGSPDEVEVLLEDVDVEEVLALLELHPTPSTLSLVHCRFELNPKPSNPRVGTAISATKIIISAYSGIVAPHSFVPTLRRTEKIG